MSLQQLKAMTLGEPREELLQQLFQQKLSLPEVLSHLGALHLGQRELQAEIRQVTVRANDRFFPHPLDIPVLLLLFFQRLHSLWEECQSPEDDLHVTSFAIYSILSIHPFENGNGRTSVDFGQWLLMNRWNVSVPPMLLPKDAHTLIARYVATLDIPCDGENPEAFYRLRQHLANYFEGITLEQIKATKPFQIVAGWLKQSLREDTFPPTP